MFSQMRTPALVSLLGALVACGEGGDFAVARQSAGLIDAQGTVQAIAEGKCDGWGYTEALSPAHHAACVRMAMADYCGDGRSFTMNGTRIDLYDDMKLNTDSTPASSPFKLEAIWAAEGKRARLVCLSHARWDTLPPGGVNCPGSSPRDPRLFSTADVCDNLSWDTWQSLSVGPGPLFKVRLGNDSAFLDKGLYRWQGGGDHYTTALHRYDDAPLGYAGPPSFEGAAFWGSEVEAVYPGSGAYLTPLLECERAAPFDRFTTTAPPTAAGYSCVVTSARVFRPNLDPLAPPAGMPADLQTLLKLQGRALYSYRHSIGQRHITVMDGNPKPPLYNADERLEGFVLFRSP